MAVVLLACGHHADVDHVRGDRRVQCICGGVSNVVARPQQVVTYKVLDLAPPPAAEAGAVNVLVVALAFALGVAVVVMLVLFGCVETPDVEYVDAAAPARDLAEPATTTTAPATTTTTTAAPSKRATITTVDVAVDGVEAQIVAVFSQFGADVADQAVDVATCESNLNPAETGDAGERGVMQIHPVHIDRVERLGFTWDQMYEVGPNLAVAADIYAESAWGPWTCKSGGDHG